MKNIFLLLAAVCISIASPAQKVKTSFYVLGQPDQWQLFMSADVGKDIHASHNKADRVVLIHLTSGDGSCSPGAGLNTAYYQAKEEGTRKAVQIMATYPHRPAGQSWHIWFDVWDLPLNTHTLDINGHVILRKQYKNVFCYYLRLPDGCHAAGLNGESLEYLQKGTISSITAIDKSTTYHGWNDLVATINSIMSFEAGLGSDSARIWLNVADTDPNINPGDHPDNIYAAHAGIDAFSTLQGRYATRLYQEFSTASLPSNDPEDIIVMRAGMYAAGDYAATDLSQPSNWSSSSIKYLSRTYRRIVYH